jgi:hypothetical protein
MIAFAVFARISNILALAEPQRDSYELPRQTAKFSVPKPVAIQYPKLDLSENIYQRVKDNSKEDGIPVRIERGRIAGGSSKELKDNEIFVLDPTALQNARLNLSENTYERVENNKEEWRIADVLSKTSSDKPVRTYPGVIDEVGKMGQPDIAELIKTGERHKYGISTGGKVHTESFLEGVKASSQKMLENLSDGQEKLHRKAADTLAGMEEPIIEAKGNIQTFIDKLFSAIGK